MKYPLLRKRALWSAMLVSSLLVACKGGAGTTPQATQASVSPPLNITYCDIDPSDLCLEGFGEESDEELLILLKAENRSRADIYLIVDDPEGETVFECQQLDSDPENIYCLGNLYQEGDSIKFNVYTTLADSLIAIGVFNIQFSNISVPETASSSEVQPTPYKDKSTSRTPSPEPSYPNPSYPNPSYPNPSYPNPTSTP